MPNNPIELNTRLLTHTIGILTLLFSFLLIKNWSNNFYALIFTTLIAVNQIIAFSTFVTVYDGLNFMLLITSLYFLTIYLTSENKNWGMLLSAILLGIGISAKLSLLILALPTTFFFILRKSETLVKTISNGLYLYLLIGIFYLTTKRSIVLLKTDPKKGIPMLLGGIVLFLLSYILISKYKKTINKTLKKLNRRKLLIPSTIILVLLVAFLSFKHFLPTQLLSSFLTDSRLIASFKMYEKMVLTQFVPYLGQNTFIFFLPGFFLLLLLKKSNIKFLGITFFLTAIFFWVLTSKSMFFHNYYTIIIMFSMILVVSIFIFYSIVFFPNSRKKLFLLIMYSLLLLYPSISSVKKSLSRERKGFEEAAEYLVENTDENDSYFYEGYLLPLTIRTGRPGLYSTNSLKDESFKEDVQELGLKGALDKYNIKYYITPYGSPTYERFVHIFLENEEETPLRGKGRTDIILERVTDSYKTNSKEGHIEMADLIEKYQIRERIVFEKQIGEYRFFRFETPKPYIPLGKEELKRELFSS